uniref:Uncharacterized protein n=1 Tax=Candidatus Kentrum sp. LPFa TaxID=2126335 RepID=A0A450W6J3_9GAMM|nr:MAG: hypothetical protein BECKLPF1236A_GA0070988_1007215 [Candidatus Kentron sp. LPFa]VFK28747.1 MAG: hypothetical protein BECKLPF1236C_GA0070990_1007314 [Candidatus Kentron sp. LPFa]
MGRAISAVGKVGNDNIPSRHWDTRRAHEVFVIVHAQRFAPVIIDRERRRLQIDKEPCCGMGDSGGPRGLVFVLARGDRGKGKDW